MQKAISRIAIYEFMTDSTDSTISMQIKDIILLILSPEGAIPKNKHHNDTHDAVESWQK